MPNMLSRSVIIEDFVFIIACNTIHTGKAMKIAPLAKVDDGKIDIVIVRKASRVQLLKLFPKLFILFSCLSYQSPPPSNFYSMTFSAS